MRYIDKDLEEAIIADAKPLFAEWRKDWNTREERITAYIHDMIREDLRFAIPSSDDPEESNAIYDELVAILTVADS